MQTHHRRSLLYTLVGRRCSLPDRQTSVPCHTNSVIILPPAFQDLVDLPTHVDDAHTLAESTITRLSSDCLHRRSVGHHTRFYKAESTIATPPPWPHRLSLEESTIATHIRLPHRRSIGNAIQGFTRRNHPSPHLISHKSLSLEESTIGRLSSDCLHRWSVGHQSPAIATCTAPSLIDSPRISLIASLGSLLGLTQCWHSRPVLRLPHSTDLSGITPCWSSKASPPTASLGRSVGHQSLGMATTVQFMALRPSLSTLSYSASPHQTPITLSPPWTPNSGNDFNSSIKGSISRASRASTAMASTTSSIPNGRVCNGSLASMPYNGSQAHFLLRLLQMHACALNVATCSHSLMVLLASVGYCLTDNVGFSVFTDKLQNPLDSECQLSFIHRRAVLLRSGISMPTVTLLCHYALNSMCPIPVVLIKIFPSAIGDRRSLVSQLPPMKLQDVGQYANSSPTKLTLHSESTIARLSFDCLHQRFVGHHTRFYKVESTIATHIRLHHWQSVRNAIQGFTRKNQPSPHLISHKALSLAESTIARLSSDCLHRRSVGHQSPAMATCVAPSLTGSPRLQPLVMMLIPIKLRSHCHLHRHQILGTTSTTRLKAPYPSPLTLRLLLHLPFTPSSPSHSQFFCPPDWALEYHSSSSLSTCCYALSLKRKLEYALAGNTSNS
eukprot:Gb_00495 [translate_table: standard]